MNTIKIEKPDIDIDGGFATVSSSVAIGNKKQDIWFRTNSKYIDSAEDYSNVFLAALLIPSMRLGKNMEINGTISQKLLENTENIQRVFNDWFPELKIVSVIPKNTANKKMDEENSHRREAAFFSGGVDSFYTLLRHKRTVEKLIFVHGFDVNIQDRKTQQSVRKHLKNVSESLNKELVEVETNVKEFGVPVVSWPDHYHGSALASVALLLSNKIDLVFIPSSQSFQYFRPYGSNLLTDRLWGTENLELVYDSYETTRKNKIREICNQKIVQDHLRVCWEKPHEYNCSKCEKCIRTMINLDIFDALDKFKTFENKIDISAIPGLQLSGRSDSTYVKAFEELEKRKDRKKLRAALGKFIENRRNKRLSDELFANLDSFLRSENFTSNRGVLVDGLWKHHGKFLLKSLPKNVSSKLYKKLAVKRKK